MKSLLPQNHLNQSQMSIISHRGGLPTVNNNIAPKISSNIDDKVQLQ